MKNQKRLLACALSFALVACGSGGGGSSSPAPQQAEPPATTSPTVATTPSTAETTPSQVTVQPSTAVDTPQTPSAQSATPSATTEPVATPKVEEPEKPKITGYYSEIGSSFQSSYSNDNFTSLEIWSKKFPLSDPLAKEAEEGWQYTNYSVKDGKDQGNIISTFLDYAKIGNVGDGQSDYAFAIGYATPIDKIPTAGKYTYEGKHLITVQDDEEHKQDASKPIQLHTFYGGDAKFEADFSQKSLVGSFKLIDDSHPFEAKISGNSFQTGFFDNLAVKGKFYGPNAEELAGTYQAGKVGERNIIGAFGAKQVKEAQVQPTE